MTRFDTIFIGYVILCVVNISACSVSAYTCSFAFSFTSNFMANLIFSIMIFFTILPLCLLIPYLFLFSYYNYSLVNRGSIAIFKTDLVIKKSELRKSINNIGFAYCLNEFNVKTIAVYQVSNLALNEFKEARLIGNNYIRERFKKANNYCSLLPHWSYEINIFSYDGDYDEGKAQRLVSKLNSDKSILNKKFNFLYFSKEKRLVVNKFIVDYRFFIPSYFLAYRKAIKLTCKAFNLDYSKFTYEL